MDVLDNKITKMTLDLLGARIIQMHNCEERYGLNTLSVDYLIVEKDGIKYRVDAYLDNQLLIYDPESEIQ